MNILDTQNDLKNFSEEQLIGEMQAPKGNAPQFLVLGEMTRRKKMRADHDRRKAQDNTRTVAEDAIAAAGAPQSGIMGMAKTMAPNTDVAGNTGIGQLRQPPPQAEPAAAPQGYAQGGIVESRYAEGGMVEGGVDYTEYYRTHPEELNKLMVTNPEAYDHVMNALTQPSFGATSKPVERPPSASPFNKATPRTSPMDRLGGAFGSVNTGIENAFKPITDALGPSPKAFAEKVLPEHPMDAIKDSFSAPYIPLDESGNVPPSMVATALPKVQEWGEGVLSSDMPGSVDSVGDFFGIGGGYGHGPQEGDLPPTPLGSGPAPINDPAAPIAPAIVQPKSVPPLAPAPQSGGVGTSTGGGTSGGGAGTSKIVSDMSEAEKNKERDKWLSVARMGFTMMASKSPFFGDAVGEGGLAALDSYAGANERYEDAVQAMRDNETKMKIASMRKAGSGSDDTSGTENGFPKNWTSKLVGEWLDEARKEWREVAGTLGEDHEAAKAISGEILRYRAFLTGQHSFDAMVE